MAPVDSSMHKPTHSSSAFFCYRYIIESVLLYHSSDTFFHHLLISISRSSSGSYLYSSRHSTNNIPYIQDSDYRMCHHITHSVWKFQFQIIKNVILNRHVRIYSEAVTCQTLLRYSQLAIRVCLFPAKWMQCLICSPPYCRSLNRRLSVLLFSSLPALMYKLQDLQFWPLVLQFCTHTVSHRSFILTTMERTSRYCAHTKRKIPPNKSSFCFPAASTGPQRS